MEERFILTGFSLFHVEPRDGIMIHGRNVPRGTREYGDNIAQIKEKIRLILGIKEKMRNII